MVGQKSEFDKELCNFVDNKGIAVLHRGHFSLSLIIFKIFSLVLSARSNN